jgi:hypothetical protein
MTSARSLSAELVAAQSAREAAPKFDSTGIGMKTAMGYRTASLLHADWLRHATMRVNAFDTSRLLHSIFHLWPEGVTQRN